VTLPALATGSQLARVLIGGTASLLICIFLSPKVHQLPADTRVRAQVRDDDQPTIC